MRNVDLFTKNANNVQTDFLDGIVRQAVQLIETGSNDGFVSSDNQHVSFEMLDEQTRLLLNGLHDEEIQHAIKVQDAPLFIKLLIEKDYLRIDDCMQNYLKSICGDRLLKDFNNNNNNVQAYIGIILVITIIVVIAIVPVLTTTVSGGDNYAKYLDSSPILKLWIYNNLESNPQLVINEMISILKEQQPELFNISSQQFNTTSLLQEVL